MQIALCQVKDIYRAAIDPAAHDGEGENWWAAVAREVAAVIGADSVATAASVITWWHHDWSAVGDSPRAAAGRIRRVARLHRQ
ncbi:hypothetical protein [Achromobacter insuavis]|uniref:hypothetical protein n=1 Tax=Achromobacter insuavis TaxID=1287735 RepID=UPI001F134836|nr:hypothetical protein [Achromobacter insuavis]